MTPEVAVQPQHQRDSTSVSRASRRKRERSSVGVLHDLLALRVEARAARRVDRLVDEAAAAEQAEQRDGEEQRREQRQHRVVRQRGGAVAHRLRAVAGHDARRQRGRHALRVPSFDARDHGEPRCAKIGAMSDDAHPEDRRPGESGSAHSERQMNELMTEARVIMRGRPGPVRVPAHGPLPGAVRGDVRTPSVRCTS